MAFFPPTEPSFFFKWEVSGEVNQTQKYSGYAAISCVHSSIKWQALTELLLVGWFQQSADSALDGNVKEVSICTVRTINQQRRALQQKKSARLRLSEETQGKS